MALELLGFIRRGGKYHAPTRLVRCTACGAEFARTGWPSDIRSARGCQICSNLGNQNARRYANPKERKRAQNQRCYMRRKAREAAT